jgi:hypothetical protein
MTENACGWFKVPHLAMSDRALQALRGVELQVYLWLMSRANEARRRLIDDEWLHGLSRTEIAEELQLHRGQVSRAMAKAASVAQRHYAWCAGAPKDETGDGEGAPAQHSAPPAHQKRNAGAPKAPHRRTKKPPYKELRQEEKTSSRRHDDAFAVVRGLGVDLSAAVKSAIEKHGYGPTDLRELWAHIVNNHNARNRKALFVSHLKDGVFAPPPTPPPPRAFDGTPCQTA